ncbi:hypothetical protein ACFQZT_32665 [Paenibacillus sp. GCM10027628]|uniref:hypothetical protein n=1 Tax=Paenibacillus sp. GCM10027628 TaxID=3273413 RepID=UPI003626AE7A
MRALKIFINILIPVLFLIIALPYQYEMRPSIFYLLTFTFLVICFVRVVLTVVNRRPGTYIRGVILLILLSPMIYWTCNEVKDQAINFKIKNKVAAYLPNVPLDIVHYQRLDQHTLEYQSSLVDEQAPMNDLSNETGSKTIFIKKKIQPSKSVDLYTIRFKNTYKVNDVDISKKW